MSSARVCAHWPLVRRISSRHIILLNALVSFEATTISLRVIQNCLRFRYQIGLARFSTGNPSAFGESAKFLGCVRCLLIGVVEGIKSDRILSPLFEIILVSLTHHFQVFLFLI